MNEAADWPQGGREFDHYRFAPGDPLDGIDDADDVQAGLSSTAPLLPATRWRTGFRGKPVGRRPSAPALLARGNAPYAFRRIDAGAIP